jgi:3-methyladenine DNA glycosylase/8-oxoguanine DNA glycosylase
MPSRFTIAVPSDYLLRRDYCSYGYFLLAPNHWEPETLALTRVLGLEGGAVTVRVTQPGDKAGSPLRVEGDRQLSAGERGQASAHLGRMLRLDEGYEQIRAFHAVDPRWRRGRGRGGGGATSGRGRMMRSPTLFEDVIKTVTSCNVTWPSTVTMNRRLCEVFGARSASGGWAFPTAQRLSRARPQTLRSQCSVGYRDGRIVELARLFTLAPARGGIDEAWLADPVTPDEAVRESLLELPGIGPYAAANIMQLLGRYSRLPLDSESLRHGRTVLGYTGNERQVMKRLHEHYAPFGAHAFRSYWLELWAHYERKNGPAWTWRQEKTAKAFVAALMKEKAPGKRAEKTAERTVERTAEKRAEKA